MSRSLCSGLIWSLGLTAVASLAGCGTNIPKETTSSATPSVELGSSSSTDASPAVPTAGLKRIIILTNSASSYWDPCRAGVLDSVSQLKLNDAGLTAVMEVNDGTLQGQLDKLRQYGSQTDVAAIGICPINATNSALVDELKKFRDRGIQVITIDSDFDRSLFRDTRHAFLGTDNAAGGRALGQCALALRPEGGSYVAFVGETGAQNAIDRIAGLVEGAGEKFTSKDTMADATDRSRARENVRNAIRNHPDLNTLAGIWSYNAPAIVDVVRELNVREKFKVVVFDAEPLTIQAMKDGDVDVLIVQDPYAMGYQGVRMLAALVKKDEAVLSEMLPNFGQPDGDLFDTGLKVVVPGDQSPIKADLFTGKITHMTLSTFQAWLDKYGLSGS
ncbi:MAG: substrate-binding domain-containing protein [Planctomycetaceae bacterium]|nr:substrate-binding domain-containing protein [Planctomycetaceae bacterium]